MTTWLTDSNGNRCSVEYFGSQEAAQQALDSLENCRDCSDCSYCSYCSGCSDCSDCSRCSDCSGTDDKSNPAPVIPKIENIDAAVLDACSVPHALNMSNWHTCETTHCRAGWVVHLAGEAGYALERFHNTALAAQLIYRESGSPINPCRFFDSDEEAMEDMRKRAGL